MVVDAVKFKKLATSCGIKVKTIPVAPKTIALVAINNLVFTFLII